MANGYTQVKVVSTGATILASDHNDECEALEDAFNATTGHTHDGTVGGGAKIPTAGISGLTNTSSGIFVANGANASLVRTLTGTSNEITVTNGTGVSGNPTLSLPSALTFTGKTVTGGTFSSPTLTGTPIADVLQTSGSSGVALKNSGGTTVLTVGSANSTNSTFAGAVNINGTEAATSISNTQTLTNKTLNLTNNTLTGTIAQFNTACSDADFATLAGSETLTNKTLNLTNNTLTGTIAQFNTACSDADFATLAGSETLTNKVLTTPRIVGVTNASSATAGDVGEYQSVTVLSGAAVALTSTVVANITSISLTAGDWDVMGNCVWQGTGSTSWTQVDAQINTSSAAFATFPCSGAAMRHTTAALVASTPFVHTLGNLRFNVSSTQSVYLNASATFSASTGAAYGFLGARRRR